MADSNSIRIGIVGARGYVGAELIRLIAGHPRFGLAYVSSRGLDGERVADHNADYAGDLRYSAPSHEALPALGADAVVIALPNGKAGEIVQAFEAAKADPVIIDLSADFRFDPSWYYGLPELTRKAYTVQRRVSHQGCSATAKPPAIAPMPTWLDGPVPCGGVSGDSDAGNPTEHESETQ